MISVPSQEIKRRGIGLVDQISGHEPVHVIRNNRPEFVILREEDYQVMLEDLALTRVLASEADLHAGRLHRGNAADLMREIETPEPAS